MDLSKSQKAALDHITTYAKSRKGNAVSTMNHICLMCNISQQALAEAVDKIKSHARVALHFHPDRPGPNKKPVAESLLECGIYKSQFETLLSNGSVSAFPGGERDRWEHKIFGGAYNLDASTNGHRPKYGALDLMLHPDGPAPRFGSCYFLLRPEVTKRCTFTYLDSHQDPHEKGTLAEFDDIVAALLSEAFLRDFAIGEYGLTPGNLVRHLLANLDRPFSDPSQRAPARNLNHYIEAQVHGDVRLAYDVDVLVADPSFQGTAIGRMLEQTTSKYGIHVYWHCGFALPLDQVPNDFRGSTMPSLAQRISSERHVDVSMIGAAAMDLKRNSEAWNDRGASSEVLQELKILWHVLVKFGKPLRDIKY